MKSPHRFFALLSKLVTYVVLIGFATIMLFPFIFMFSTSFKTQRDTFRYPPRLLPREQLTATVPGYPEPLPLYYVTVEGQLQEYALVESNIRMGVYTDPDHPDVTYTLPLDEIQPTGGVENQRIVLYNNTQELLWDVPVDGHVVPMVLINQTAFGRFADPASPCDSVLQNVRLSEPVEKLTIHPGNYAEVTELQGLDRSLTNTVLVTILVMVGQLATSIVGGYALARLQFPGREQLFIIYLGTIMIPFVVLVTPLYQFMVLIGWVDKLVSLILPWIFTAYGTFLMRQFFITIPKEIEEAALLDGASHLQILTKIFIPASVPALATLATFTFLYAWNSFFWPLVVINTGNRANHVLTLSLSILRGRAADNVNLVMAGAAIAILPPMIVYILAQRFFVESATSSGLKG
ncbi:MAG: carbohydrate ABC transporter permease [Anaerolineales bacterium]|nr:carbohydrate ABC transporter permease [Anaerolineales bacterium]